MKCANLGIDESPELLGGIWSRIKKGASAVASGTISAAKSSGIPVISQGASILRSVGETAEKEGWIPGTLRTGSSSPAPAAYAPAKDNTLLYIGAGAIALLLLMKRK